MKVWIDGQIVDGKDARIPVTDHGFLYGDGVFEGMRAYAGRMFRLDDHMARLEVSARAIGLEIPGGTERVRDIVLQTVAATGSPEAYVRLIVTRGEGPLGIDPTTCPQARILCIVDTVELFTPEKSERGVALITASLRRPAADVLDPRVKSLNYLNNAMVKLEARRQGADDALLLNASGAIAEASGANIFAVCRGVLTTPPVTDGALEGITRQTVLELAGEAAIPARERSMGRVDLFGASEAFLTGSGARIVPVRSLDGQPVGSAVPGPVTARLRAAFFELARSTGTPVPYPGVNAA
ncbi:MAG TPA: branched-chain-amino-acid transaminase [Candidatus Limnocylindrales bacterium]|nr:branched-chain-amino-acid transaminase [Candidatus Limnocylindrales bacterium]